MRNKFLAVAVLLPLLTAPASAHVTLAETSAKAGSEFVAAFRVGHGCGTSPTLSLTVEIPAGVATARPQAKPGWTIEQQTEPARTHAITWRGSLAADQFDDFRILLRLPGKAGLLIFPVTQTCATGVEHWSEVPVPGRKLTRPAPVLAVTPGSAAGGRMPGMVMP